MAQELCVYFVNNQKARLPMEKTIFARDILGVDSDIYEALESGMIFVNWAHVCYVRKREEERDDAE